MSFTATARIHVAVQFSPSVARYVQESTWHASQKLTKLNDSSLLVEFDLDGTEEIMRWILSFGRHAEVIEPEELRRAIVLEMQALASIDGCPRSGRAVAKKESGHG
ncbi:MAG: WYL domain-containing protein [Thermoguttaceae bacterium]